MPHLDGEDPIIVAALIDDDDDEESKQLTKEFLDQADDDDKEIVTPAADEENDDDDKIDVPAPKKPADDEDDDDDEKPKPATPPEAIDANGEDDEPKGDDAEKKSRSERRAERQRKYLERLSAAPVDPKEQARRELLDNNDYKPLDIKDGEYEPDDLIKDRQAYGNAQLIKGVETQRQLAEEQNFWTSVEYEAKLLNTNPDFAFLDESNKEAFDEKKAQHINDLYFKVIGLENVLVRDKNGLPIVNAQGEAMVRPTVRRKDLGFKEFVEGYVENMMSFDQDNEAEITKNVVKQRAHQGVRPGGSSRRGLGKIREGDIAKMSTDDYEANEAEIDRQINAELGIS